MPERRTSSLPSEEALRILQLEAGIDAAPLPHDATLEERLRHVESVRLPRHGSRITEALLFARWATEKIDDHLEKAEPMMAEHVAMVRQMRDFESDVKEIKLALKGDGSQIPGLLKEVGDARLQFATAASTIQRTVVGTGALVGFTMAVITLLEKLKVIP